MRERERELETELGCVYVRVREAKTELRNGEKLRESKMNEMRSSVDEFKIESGDHELGTKAGIT